MAEKTLDTLFHDTLRDIYYAERKILSALGIGLGAVIALLYWVVMSVFIAVGKAGLLPPILAAWTPNIIVTACAAYLLLTART